MSYFDKSSNRFLQSLAKNNSREWFAGHKPEYQKCLQHPAAEFADAMAQQLQILNGSSLKPKIFRIYRDVRFSKDKTPYNTHLRISFVPEHGPAVPPGWFFSLEQDHLVLGSGVFGYEKSELIRFRERIAGPEGVELQAILHACQQQGMRISEPDLKRVPAGYDSDHPRADLLRHKGLAVWLDKPDATLAYGSDAVPNCLAEYQRLWPLFNWLNQ